MWITVLTIGWLLTLSTTVLAQPAPAPAPRQPVHKATPVVPPHGSTHPHRPTPTPPAKAPPTAKGPPPATPQPAAPPAQPSPSAAEKLPDPEKPESGPAKLPRFASLRSDEVNMRAGPGLRYRIEWVYKRRDLPVEIEREFDVWRYVRDVDGIQGWMQQATLMGRRSFIVHNNEAVVRAEANDKAQAVAVLKPGVVGRIRSCEPTSDWCNIQSGSYRGWLRREQFWGTLPKEAINP